MSGLPWSEVYLNLTWSERNRLHGISSPFEFFDPEFLGSKPDFSGFILLVYSSLLGLVVESKSEMARFLLSQFDKFLVELSRIESINFNFVCFDSSFCCLFCFFASIALLAFGLFRVFKNFW